MIVTHHQLPDTTGAPHAPVVVPGAVDGERAASTDSTTGPQIERQLCRWLADRLGLPADAGGYVTASGAMGVFVALKAARDARAGWSIRELGTRAGPPLACYATDATHPLGAHAADMLGSGREAVRVVPCDADGCMDAAALRSAVTRDVRNGFQPVAALVAGDPSSRRTERALDAVADACEATGLWMHAEVVPFSTPPGSTLRGFRRADSVGIAAGTWLHVTHAGGVILVRDPATVARAFALAADDDVPDARDHHLRMLGSPSARDFQALEAWVALRTRWPEA